MSSSPDVAQTETQKIRSLRLFVNTLTFDEFVGSGLSPFFPFTRTTLQMLIQGFMGIAIRSVIRIMLPVTKIAKAKNYVSVSTYGYILVAFYLHPDLCVPLSLSEKKKMSFARKSASQVTPPQVCWGRRTVYLSACARSSAPLPLLTTPCKTGSCWMAT